MRVAQGFLKQISVDATSSLRPCLMIASICKDHEITASVDDPDFRDLCRDILLSRAGQSIEDANEILWMLFNQFDETVPAVAVQPKDDGRSNAVEPNPVEQTAPPKEQLTVAETAFQSDESPEPLAAETTVIQNDAARASAPQKQTTKIQSDDPTEGAPQSDAQAGVQTPASKIQAFLGSVSHARLSEIEQKTGLNRVAVVNGLRTLIQQQCVEKQEAPGKPAMYKTK